MATQHESSTTTITPPTTTPAITSRPKITKLSPGSGIFELSLPSGVSIAPSTSNVSSTQDGPPHKTAESRNSQGGKARFSTLSASYPLKLLTPTPLNSQPFDTSLLYTLAYGGGLVSGDVISLRGNVNQGCGLVMLTQGSTKVYKKRPGIRPKSDFRTKTNRNQRGEEGGLGLDVTKQRLHIKLEPHSFLLLLPDSISPFKRSKYAQIQRFILPSDKSASILVLDWVNSGRGQRQIINHRNHALHQGNNMDVQENVSDQEDEEEDEIWSMDYYNSINEIYLGDQLIMREKMILDNSPTTSSPTASSMSNPQIQKRDKSLSKIAKSLAPYNVYATILFTGPHLLRLSQNLKKLSDEYRQYQEKNPKDLIWSFSELTSHAQASEINSNSGIIRIASIEIELIRFWLRDLLGKSGIPDLVGEGIWPRCI